MQYSRRAWMAATGAALFLSACEDSGAFAWKPETDAERELRLSRERLQSTVGEGSLAGAAGGAVLGGLVGGVQGGFQGAQVGRFGGAAAGLYVRQLQERYANQEAVLNQVASDLRTTNATLEQNIAAMRQVLAERASRAEADPTRDQRNADEARASVSAAEQQAAFFGQARSVLVKDGSAVASSGIDPELARLRNRIGTMRAIADDLAAL